ncbi:MAG TPA: Ldh family oxidoreductase, partial [Thermoanaerobaculia bacterium]|nr:Ldh family oxidoreductase [Thermoanaerobaculia bacterium]
AVRLARESGCGAVVVTGSNHFGAAAVYTLAMARRGTVGLAFTNSDALVAPFGGKRPLFGTNPVSLAVRGEGRDLFCADFATSQVSYSRVKAYREAGRPVEPGWALAADGADAAAVPSTAGSAGGAVAALQPLGGYKGECLGMMVEILCALLAGTPFDHELSHLYEPPYDAPRQVAHLFVALDVGAFTEPDAFRARVSRLLALVRGAPAAGAGPVLAPGDPEAAAAAERRRSGIPLAAAELAALQRIDAEDEPGERLGLGEPVEP